MQKDFVELRHVNVVRGTRQVLHDVSLRIGSGECVAILGPNGCGKSTLLKTLTCELYPLAEPSMRVNLFGRARWDVAELRRKLGVVSSEPPVRDALGVPGLEIVLSGFFSAARLWPYLVVTTEMRARAERAMAAAGVASLATRALGELSSGQQKRLMIARALAAGGEGSERVLLLDEPSNALDLAAQRDLRATVQQLAEGGTGVILITHRVEDLVPAVQRVLLMRDGRLVGDGSPEQMITGGQLSSLFGVTLDVSVRDGVFSAR